MGASLHFLISVVSSFPVAVTGPPNSDGCRTTLLFYTEDAIPDQLIVDIGMEGVAGGVLDGSTGR